MARKKKAEASGAVELVLLRDRWTEKGRERKGQVVTVEVNEAMGLIEKKLARRLTEDDEVSRIENGEAVPRDADS